MEPARSTSTGQPEPAKDLERQLAEEMAALPYEPLLPVEKKLIFWSLALGVGLLVLLGWLSMTWFPVPAGPVG